MIDLSRYAFVALRKDEGFILCRGRSNVDGSQILVLSPVTEHPTPESLQRLESEYSLRGELEPAWAARPIAIARHWDRTVLVLEDPGGVPLDQWLGQPLDRSFEIARVAGSNLPGERGFKRACSEDLPCSRRRDFV